MKKNILINIVIFLILLVALEGFCSLFFYIKDVKNPLILSKSVMDFPYVYYSFIPEKKNASMIVNDDGLYTHYTRQKPKGAIRILLIGGSTARGMFSSPGHTLSDILERLLQKEFADTKIEVVNAGMSGYVAEQMFIFYQLILSKYNPDIVIGLNGYNDLMTVKLNRQSGFYFAPQNMQQFQVIADGKKKNTLMGRISHIFPGIFRLLDFIKREVAGQSQYNYATFNEKEIEEAASTYINIIKDLHSFCKINGVAHLEFLQPIKWYFKGSIEKSIKNGGILQLAKLYSSYDKSLTQLDYGYSLTDLFNDKGVFFIDDCHVFDAGTDQISSAMLVPIKKELIKKIRQEGISNKQMSLGENGHEGHK